MPYSDPDKRREMNALYARRARAANPARERETQRRYRESGKKPGSRLTNHASVAGLPSTALAQKFCDACGVFTPKPEIDHSHAEMVFRGMLCHRCNVIMGKVDEDPSRIGRYHEGIRLYFEGAVFR